MVLNKPHLINIPLLDVSGFIISNIMQMVPLNTLKHAWLQKATYKLRILIFMTPMLLRLNWSVFDASLLLLQHVIGSYIN